MADLPEFLWDDENVAHIARHKVTPAQVVSALTDPDLLVVPSDTDRPGRLLVFATTATAAASPSCSTARRPAALTS